jgi:hypothetical protein
MAPGHPATKWVQEHLEIQSAGSAYRLPALLIKEEFDRGSRGASPVPSLQVSADHADGPNSGINKHHSLDQQLRRWLLLSLDRLQVREMV